MPDYVALARKAITALLDQEHAAVWPEIEAKCADTPFPGIGTRLDPHVLSAARRQLLSSNVIEEISSRTRGLTEQPIVALCDRTRRQTAFQKAAQRKRLLKAMYLTWTRGERGSKRPNVIGQGGEILAHAALVSAASGGIGYMLEQHGPTGVTSMLDFPLYGPLDDGAYLTVRAPGARFATIAIPIEVKNLRHWIYPASAELYQLLSKAADLQLANPGQLIVPILIARQVHYTTFTMARDLGFLALYTRSQPIMEHSTVRSEALSAVNQELAYNIILASEPPQPLVNGFTRSLPTNGLEIAQRWARRPSFVPTTVRAGPDPMVKEPAPGWPLGWLVSGAHSLPIEIKLPTGFGAHDAEQWSPGAVVAAQSPDDDQARIGAPGARAFPVL